MKVKSLAVRAATATASVALMLVLAPAGILSAALSIGMNEQCVIYGRPGAELCGAMLDKYVEFGGPEGPLGPPISGELITAAGDGRMVLLHNDAEIYWSPATGAHVISGETLAKWVEIGAENGVLGYPVSDELRNSGSYARFGDRRTDFENGAIYSKGGQAGVGYWTTMTADSGTGSSSESVVPRLSEVPLPAETSPTVTPDAPSGASASGVGAAGSNVVVSGAVYRAGLGRLLVPAQAEPETCPPSTTAYSGDQFIYNCLSVDTQVDGYSAGVREGKPDPTPGEVAVFGPQDITGFGRAHADVDHNVGYRSLRLLLRSDARPEFLTARPELNRWRQVLVFRFDNEIIEGLAAVVQRMEDDRGLAPDAFDIGLITAYCADGTDPGVPGTPHPGGRCPDDLPSPFGKAAGGA